MYDSLQAEIAKYRGQCLQIFDNPNSATTHEWFELAEPRLGFALPPSYKWVFSGYSGLSIHGYDVYSIAPPDFWQYEGDDLIGRYAVERRSGLFPENTVPLYTTDFGELFAWDITASTGDGEFPVYQYLGLEHRGLYANSFAAFLERLLSEHCAPGATAPG